MLSKCRKQLSQQTESDGPAGIYTVYTLTSLAQRGNPFSYPRIIHCTVKKHIFPEMKLCGLIPNFCIHVSGTFIYSHNLIWNLHFPALCEKTFSSTTGVERRAGGNCRQAEVDGSSPPFPPLLMMSRGFTSMTHIKFRKLRIIYFLFRLKVNEIPHKTFILDSHCTASNRPFLSKETPAAYATHRKRE